MLYKYELHLHTMEASACAIASGKDMARAAKEAGYSGIVVTDHHIGGNTCIDRSLPWEDFVEGFCKGYEEAKKEGDKIGLDVFFGWEAGFMGTEFLIYGLSKKWMLEHPEIKEATVEELFNLVDSSGGIMIHAHPYREAPYIKEIRLFPEHVHGVELINAAHSNPSSLSHNNRSFNEHALDYARKYNFPVTAGSDIHHTKLLGGGMYFEKRITTEEELVSAILNKNYHSITDGFSTWTKQQIESENPLY